MRFAPCSMPLALGSQKSYLVFKERPGTFYRDYLQRDLKTEEPSLLTAQYFSFKI
jgi:hypothetical protein